MAHLANLRRVVGDELKKNRSRHGFTQKVVASYLGISRSVYAAKELGVAFPTIDQLLKLSTLYKMTISDFFPFHPSSIEYAQMVQKLKDENLKLKNKNRELKTEVSRLKNKSRRKVIVQTKDQ